jgi:hypothetical protein
MARILLNTRASRITIAADIVLLPAEVKDDERLGKVVVPSRTLISEQGDPSPYQQIEKDPPTQKLLGARIIEWSDDKVEEPDPVADPRVGTAALPRADQADKAVKQSGSDEADVDLRATIDESGRPLDEFARVESAAGRARSNATSPTGGFRPRNPTQQELASTQQRSERVSTSAEVEAAALPSHARDDVSGVNPSPGAADNIAGANPAPAAVPGAHVEPAHTARHDQHKPKGSGRGG